MPRYDLMHWSQRVRDQQAAARAAQSAPSALPTPARQPAKPRASRPKPPRDEEAEQLLCLCREGRLFELQAWVAAGKSLSVPAHYRQTPMRIALNTGFHSLIALAQAFGNHAAGRSLDLKVLSNNIHRLSAEPLCYPARATLLGPCKVIPQEYRGVRCQSIDIDLSPGTQLSEDLLDSLAGLPAPPGAGGPTRAARPAVL